jgi:hypothetical protein
MISEILGPKVPFADLSLGSKVPFPIKTRAGPQNCARKQTALQRDPKPGFSRTMSTGSDSGYSSLASAPTVGLPTPRTLLHSTVRRPPGSAAPQRLSGPDRPTPD